MYIGIDIVDVIFPVQEYLIRRLEQSGYKYTLISTLGSDFEKLAISKEGRVFIKSTLESKEFWDSLPLEQDIIATIHELMKPIITNETQAISYFYFLISNKKQMNFIPTLMREKILSTLSDRQFVYCPNIKEFDLDIVVSANSTMLRQANDNFIYTVKKNMPYNTNIPTHSSIASLVQLIPIIQFYQKAMTTAKVL